MHFLPALPPFVFDPLVDSLGRPGLVAGVLLGFLVALR
jgi:hypothetical protein